MLDGDASRLVDYYREWASSYNLDVNRERYCVPLIVAEPAGAMQAAYVESGLAASGVMTECESRRHERSATGIQNQGAKSIAGANFFPLPSHRGAVLGRRRRI